jgi:hypothetical protein
MEVTFAVINPRGSEINFSIWLLRNDKQLGTAGSHL